jgi:hypothetical protein
MRNPHRKQKLTACLLVLTLLAGASAALADQAVTPGLVDDITWDTTIEEILEAEGVSGMEDLIAAAYTEEGTQAALVHSAEGDEPSRQFTYAFISGQLLAYGCAIASFYQPEGTDMAQYYDTYLERFSQAYGDPAGQDPERTEALYNAFITEEQMAFINAYTIWDLGDDTILYLVNMMDTNIVYMFVSESRIPTGEE